jgi:hypothetical protein
VGQSRFHFITLSFPNEDSSSTLVAFHFYYFILGNCNWSLQEMQGFVHSSECRRVRWLRMASHRSEKNQTEIPQEIPFDSRLYLALIVKTSLGDGNHHIVVHSLEKHLPLKIDDPTLLRALQCPHQSLVVLLHIGMVKELAKLDVGGSRLRPDTPNIYQQLLDLCIQTTLVDAK